MASAATVMAPSHGLLGRPFGRRRKENPPQPTTEQSLPRSSSGRLPLEDWSSLRIRNSYRSFMVDETLGKARAIEYLRDWLDTSEWRTHGHNVSIIEEEVPVLDELEGYGWLNEADGTRACRCLFRAVVVWEQVGHSLWETLQREARVREENDLRERREKLRRASEGDPSRSSEPENTVEQNRGRRSGSRDRHLLSSIRELPNEPRSPRRASFSDNNTHGRKGSLSSLFKNNLHQHQAQPEQRPGTAAAPPRRMQMHRRSSSVPVTPHRAEAPQHLDATGQRRATDPGPDTQQQHGRSRSGSKTGGLPKKISQACADAIRRGFGSGPHRREESARRSQDS